MRSSTDADVDTTLLCNANNRSFSRFAPSLQRFHTSNRFCHENQLFLARRLYFRNRNTRRKAKPGCSPPGYPLAACRHLVNIAQNQKVICRVCRHLVTVGETQ